MVREQFTLDERSGYNDEEDNPYSQNVADYYYDNDDMDKQDYAHDYYSHPIDQNYGQVCALDYFPLLSSFELSF